MSEYRPQPFSALAVAILGVSALAFGAPFGFLAVASDAFDARHILMLMIFAASLVIGIQCIRVSILRRRIDKFLASARLGEPGR